MAKKERFVMEEQWKKLESLLSHYQPLPKEERSPRNNHEVYEGITWVLHSGIPWKDLPKQYPSLSADIYSTNPCSFPCATWLLTYLLSRSMSMVSTWTRILRMRIGFLRIGYPRPSGRHLLKAARPCSGRK
jgi:transposase